MPAYAINCDECNAEYDIYVEQNDTYNRPEHCSYCGAELKSENVKSDVDETYEDNDWVDDDDSGY